MIECQKLGWRVLNDRLINLKITYVEVITLCPAERSFSSKCELV